MDGHLGGKILRGQLMVGKSGQITNFFKCAKAPLLIHWMPLTEPLTGKDKYRLGGKELLFLRPSSQATFLLALQPIAAPCETIIYMPPVAGSEHSKVIGPKWAGFPTHQSVTSSSTRKQYRVIIFYGFKLFH